MTENVMKRSATSATSTRGGADADADPRARAFRSPDGPDVFSCVAQHSEIGRADPFDVETVHEEARRVFQRMVTQATTPPGLPYGRILVLRGAAGCGKTHLIRAFRSWAHGRGLGYCGYMQMTSATTDYGRYVLNNLIDSLDQAYDERQGETTGLMRLSGAVAAVARGEKARSSLARLRENDLDQAELDDVVDELAGAIVMDDRFNRVDFDLVRIMLYLQRDDPRIRHRALKYLRCEGLSEVDRRVLGAVAPRDYGSAPDRLITVLGELMWAIDSSSLILCVDQIEDMFNQDQAEERFRRAIAALCGLASRVPSSIIVISCLESYYDAMKAHLTKPLLDRLEQNPPPIQLIGNRSTEEVLEIVATRLRHLYDTHDVDFQEDDPTFPVPRSEIERLAGQRARDVLARCHEYRERCIAKGTVAVPFLPETDGPGPQPGPPSGDLEQLWNDFRARPEDSQTEPIPEDDAALAHLLAASIEALGAERATSLTFSTQARGRMVEVEVGGPEGATELLLVGICDRSARGGGLSKQITEVEQTAAGHARSVVPVIVRSSEFPASPGAQVVRQIGELIKRGGRRVVVQDSDWRLMSAMRGFRARHETDARFADWLKESRPLSSVKSLRAMLGLELVRATRSDEGGAATERNTDPDAPPPGPARSGDGPTVGCASPALEDGPLKLGQTNDRSAAAVGLELDELTQHAAFLGGTGSGKTTLAMNLVEQALLRGVPVLLVDRKGDLCGYLDEQAEGPPDDEGPLAARRRALRERVDVALFTPGNPNGRPLSIGLLPAGYADLPDTEREEVARLAASALGGMMGYRDRQSEQGRLGVLKQAMLQLGTSASGEGLKLEHLIEYVHERDPALINAVGYLDIKLFDKLVQDLETLRLNRGSLLDEQGERLDAERLFGLGGHARPGRTRLTVISTRFLGDIPTTQFWVSRFLIEVGRWVKLAPKSSLQALLMFDEADLYLPAQREPSTKKPLEDLLRRSRSAGLGLLLATQSPGDFDYKCRENIRTWFLGRIKETTALGKLKPMLSASRVDVTDRLATQGTGEFYCVRDGQVSSLRAERCAITPTQLPDETLLDLARRSRRP